jgi:hypothetical protein
VVIRLTAVRQTVVGEGSFCADTSPAELTSCQSSTTAAGAISRYQPRPAERRRPGFPGRTPAAGAAAGAARGGPDGSGRADRGREQGEVSDFRHVIPRA